MKHSVAIFSISDSLGGAEQVLFKIAKFYSQSGNTVYIFFFHSQSNDYWKENLGTHVQIIYLNNSVKVLYDQIRKRHFQIVFSSHLMLNAVLGFMRTIGFLKTEKLIVRESTQVFGRYFGMKLLQYKGAYFFGYRNIDLVICQTTRMLTALQENVSYLSKRTNVKVIPNPFDFPSDKIVNEKVPVKHNTIVSAGRLIPEKGFEFLIRTFAKFIGKFPEFNLLILGEGDERGKLEKIIMDLNLRGRVILKGQVQNVYPYFRQAEICVVSSIKEGFPNVLLQMMSQNSRVISTDCAGGIKDLEGVCVVPVQNEKALFESMVQLLQKDYRYDGITRSQFDNELNGRSIERFIKELY